MNYDLIYGVTLQEYYDRLNEEIDFSIGAEEVVPKKVEVEITILEENYQRYAKRNHQLTDDELETAMKIRQLIEKKRKHLQRLRNWKR